MSEHRQQIEIPKPLIDSGVVRGRKNTKKGEVRGMILDPLVAHEEANTIVKTTDGVSNKDLKNGVVVSKDALKILEKRGTDYVLTASADASEQNRKAAETDALTGCGNRLKFEFVLEHNLCGDKRDKAPTGLILGDVHKFKSINDSHGHLTGDRVLKKVGKTLQTNFRQQDEVCRYGGDEFGVVLPNVMDRRVDHTLSNLDATVESALRVIRIVHNSRLQIGTSQREELLHPVMDLGVTISDENDTVDIIYSRAEHASNIAKQIHRTSKNKISVVVAEKINDGVVYKLAYKKKNQIVYETIDESKIVFSNERL